MAEEGLVFKLLVIGNASVGKTSVLLRFTDNTYEPQTTADFEYKTRVVDHRGKRVKLVIWDTAGQERFRVLTSGFYRGAQGVLVCYDVSNPTSFSEVALWLSELKRYAQNPLRVLVATKCDLAERAVDPAQAKEFAQANGMLFFETSAKEGTNINECFMKLLEDIFNKQMGVEDNRKKKQDKKSKCILL
eukprot:m51a1_g2730 putative ypt1p (189) ;mRNA; f:882096-883236